ncbi:MAG TPA: alkaline phosphatase family protein, partial [Candidatus Acidoferrales bacterium]|nr:alkaline phosphatase family protein [Candidatus Acidoferrales bacterium]
MSRPSFAAISACAVALAGCSFAARPDASPFAPAVTAASATPTPIGKYVKHVVIIIQENRTFDNVFDGFPRAHTKRYGYCGAAKVRLKPIPFVFPLPMDMVHNFTQAVTAWNDGAMNEFCLTPGYGGEPAGRFPYSYLERSEVAPYWALASQYAIADEMFPMEFGPSFTSHLALIAGTDDLNPRLAEANYPFAEPWGCDQKTPSQTDTVDVRRQVKDEGPRPCFTQFRTMADSLDAAKVSWRYYAPPIFSWNGGQLWSSFDAISAVRYGPDWSNVVTPQTRILGDAKAGRLAAMSWVVPDWKDS